MSRYERINTLDFLNEVRFFGLAKGWEIAHGDNPLLKLGSEIRDKIRVSFKSSLEELGAVANDTNLSLLGQDTTRKYLGKNALLELNTAAKGLSKVQSAHGQLLGHFKTHQAEFSEDPINGAEIRSYLHADPAESLRVANEALDTGDFVTYRAVANAPRPWGGALDDAAKSELKIALYGAEHPDKNQELSLLGDVRQTIESDIEIMVDEISRMSGLPRDSDDNLAGVAAAT